MKKRNILINVVTLLALCATVMIFAFCCTKQPIEENVEQKLQEQIIELANEDCEIEGENPTLELINVEKVGWTDYECYTYLLKTTTNRYYVSVMRNEKEIHFVDVVEKE